MTNESYDPRLPLQRGKRHGGYLDKFDNAWVKGPSRTRGEPWEWDVQLSERGQRQLGRFSRDGRHLNVSMKGEITHR